MSLAIAMDTLQSLEEFLPQVGAKILALHSAGITPVKKPDGSPVTEADQMAEDMIIARLQSLTPDIPIIAEERYSQNKNTIPVDVSGGQFWLVDALDGTREFISGGQDFTVNVGLISNNTPSLGVIHWPAGGITYSGLVEQGLANKIFPNGRRELLRAAVPGQSIRVVSSKDFGNNAQLARYLMGREVREHRHRSSSIKFCEVAEGRTDLYPRFGASCEWDIAAGHAILAAAGGSVTTSAGQPLLYGKRDFLNSDFIASGAAPAKPPR